MGHYAKIENNIVVDVNRVEEDFFDNNPDRFEGQWVKTSYNTRRGVYYKPNSWEPHEDQTRALRKNYAGVGYTYDEQRDAFIPPKKFSSWVLNEESCIWEAPIPYPEDDKYYLWNEELLEWEQVDA